MKKILYLIICLFQQIVLSQISDNTLVMSEDLILNGFFNKLTIISNNNNNYFLRGKINTYSDIDSKIEIKGGQNSIRIVPHLPETQIENSDVQVQNSGKETVIRSNPTLSPPTQDNYPKINTINIYPMPFTNVLNIKENKTKITKYVLYDSLGIKRLENTENNLSSLNINTSNLNSGLYVIYVYLEDGTIQVKNIIKN